MPLTREDIEKIKSLGYDIGEFAVRVDGEFRLKNENDKCVFLDDKGLCKIYDYRPLGCRAYPMIIMNGSCKPDYDVCPYADLVDTEDIEVGCKLARYVISRIDRHHGGDEDGLR